MCVLKINNTMPCLNVAAADKMIVSPLNLHEIASNLSVPMYHYAIMCDSKSIMIAVARIMIVRSPNQSGRISLVKAVLCSYTARPYLDALRFDQQTYFVVHSLPNHTIYTMLKGPRENTE